MKNDKKSSSRTVIPRQRRAQDAGHAEDNLIATKHMCAGVYLDRSFRQKLLKSVFQAYKNRIAPSYGFYLVPVILHARKALRVDLCQQLVVAIILGVTTVVAPVSVVLVLDLALLWYLWRTRRPLVMRALRRILPTMKLTARQQRAGLVTRMHEYAVGSAIIAVAVLLLIMLVQRNGGTAPNPPWYLRGGIPAFAACALCLIGTVCVGTAFRQRALWLLRKMDQAMVDSSASEARCRAAVIALQERHVVTVFAKYHPFIGAGTLIRSWGIPQPLIEVDAYNNPLREFADPPFSTAEIVADLSRALTELQHDRHTETRLRNLTVADRIFLEGSHGPRFSRLITEDLGTEAMNRVISDPSPAARHYLACQLMLWGGEIYTTVFAHVSLQGRTLFLSVATCALAPTRSEFHVVHEIGGVGVQAALRAIRTDVAHLPEILAAPVQVFGSIRSTIDNRKADRASAKPTEVTTNIGAIESARESAYEFPEVSYYQYQDIAKFSRIIETRIIGTITEFLKSRKVDTSGFQQQATTYLNSGIMIANTESVNLTNVAIGNQATLNTGQTAGGDVASQPSK